MDMERLDGRTILKYIHTEIYTLKSRRVNLRSQTDVNQSNVAYRFSLTWEKRYVQSGAVYHVFSRVSRTFFQWLWVWVWTAFFQWLLFDHICLNKACHNLRKVFKLSMYITNIIPHGKCFVGCLHTRCFVSLTCSISDTPQLVCKHRTRALSMKYSIYTIFVRQHYDILTRDSSIFDAGNLVKLRNTSAIDID